MPLQPFYAGYDWQNRASQGWYKYCPNCRTELTLAETGQATGQSHRPTCPSCGFVQFCNPFPTIAVYIVQNDCVLLGQRMAEPGAGLWAAPSGYIEYNEDFISAAVRETREETGLQVQIETILHVESAFLAPQYHFLTIYLLAGVVGGQLICSDEHTALKWYPLAGPMPEMAFPTDAAVIAKLASGDFAGLHLHIPPILSHHTPE